MKTKSQHKFKVPEDYFNRMENEILAKTTAENTKNKVLPFYRSVVFQMAASVAAILVITAAIWFSNTPNVTTQDDLAAKEIIYDAYFEEEITEEYQLEDDIILAEFISE